MLKKYRPFGGLFVAFMLMVTALMMSQTQVIYSQQVGGTKARNGVIGGVGGAALGFGTWLAIGGIGLTTGGAGIALGAGAFTLFGASAGGLVGVASGTSSYVIKQPLPAYAMWLWLLVLGVGLALVYHFGKEVKAQLIAWQNVHQAKRALSIDGDQGRPQEKNELA
jgi:hypothetical protein